MEVTNQTSTKLLTPRQVSEVLSIAEHTLAVWRCTKREDLPYTKIGRTVRYRASDVDAFIQRNLQQAA